MGTDSPTAGPWCHAAAKPSSPAKTSNGTLVIGKMKNPNWSIFEMDDDVGCDNFSLPHRLCAAPRGAPYMHHAAGQCAALHRHHFGSNETLQASDGEPGHDRRRHQCASCRLAAAAATSRRTVSGANACVRSVY